MGSMAPDIEELKKIHLAIKNMVTERAQKEGWSTHGISLGLAMSLSDWVGFLDELNMLPIPYDSYLDMCCTILKRCGKDDMALTLSKLMH